MIKPLRKSHYLIWKVLAILLPLLFAGALLLRPERSLPQYSKYDFLFSLKNLNGERIVFIDVQNPIKTPSCFVYARTKDKTQVLGSLSERRRYSFSVPQETEQIVLKDILNNEILSKALNEIKTE